MAQEHLDTDVVIVGAGAAGLSAARALEHADKRVLVLEARDRVGGRMVNHHFDDGTIVELGGQWLGPTQDHALDLTKELGLELFETYTDGDALSYDRSGSTRRFAGKQLPYPPWVLAEMYTVQKRIERMARTVPIHAPWDAPKAERWDSMTVATWLRANTRLRATYEFYEMLTVLIFSAQPEAISFLHFLFYIASSGSLDLLIDIEGGAQEQRVIGGSQLIAQRMADELRTPVELSSPVSAITQTHEQAQVVTAGRTVTASAVIVTTPPHLASRIQFAPALAARRMQLIQRMPMGSVIKLVAVYERPFWREHGLNGGSFSACHPVALTFDNSPPDASQGMIVGFIEARHSYEVQLLSADERQALVLDYFAELFGDKARTPIDFVELDWANEEWTGGCYGAHFVPGAWTQLGPELRCPHGRVYWAGTETATKWNGYIDGAISSGKRAAGGALERLR